MDASMRPETVGKRDDCPNPEWWTAPDGFASEVEVSVFLGNLVRLLKPKVVLETGTYKGDTAVQIGKALQEMPTPGELITLENRLGLWKEACDRVSGLPVIALHEDSTTYVPPLPHGSEADTWKIDLLFLDSEFHTRPIELWHYKQYASSRCVVVVHDMVNPHWYPEAQRMVEEMERAVQAGLVEPWLYLPTPRGLAITRYKGR